MAGRNRFDIPVTGETAPARSRRVGPMGVAGREVAHNVAVATEAQVEARRRNASDAKAFRAAQEEGRVLVRLPLADIATDDLPRDRLALEAVAASDEMDELKASIRARGQREPVEVYRDGAGRVQLKKGWRRITALGALHAETGEARFAEVLCRVEGGDTARLERYVEMVEENAVREDLTFAEMAQLAIAAQADPGCGLASVDDAVRRLYGSLHKMKRSNIRQFVVLMRRLGPALKFPKAIGRDLGAGVGRRLREDPGLADRLAPRLGVAETPAAQNAVLATVLEGQDAALAQVKPRGRPRSAKYQFRLGAAKVTAKAGECRISSEDDFSSVPRPRLEAAVAAFYAKLRED